MYGLGGGEGEAERKKRISSKFSDVLIQQYTAEVKIPEFVEVGKVGAALHGQSTRKSEGREGSALRAERERFVPCRRCRRGS